MQRIIQIDRRFNGPPTSGNGGYACGLVAAAIGESVRVRLQKPPPLDQPLEVVEHGPEAWQVLNGGGVVAVAHLTQVHAHVPAAPAYVEALGVSRHYAGFSSHEFPTCFVCGPARERGDGLRIFPGSVPGTNIVAGPWMPEISLCDELGKVRPEFIWAALDCPGYFASCKNGQLALLGELAVHINRSVHADEPCVVIGWQILVEGRKHKVGTALYDEEGECCAFGVGTWVEAKVS